MHRSTWPCCLLENISPWDRKTQRRLWSFWRRSAWFRFTTVRFRRWLAILRSSPHWRREKVRKSTCCSPARLWSFSLNSEVWILVLVLVVVLDQSAFSPAKRARLSRKYFVQLVGLSNIGILEDEDEHEDDSAN